MSRLKTKGKKRIKCRFCDKDRKKNLSYYRDWNYYCNKSCYKKFKNKEVTDGKS